MLQCVMFCISHKKKVFLKGHFFRGKKSLAVGANLRAAGAITALLCMLKIPWSRGVPWGGGQLHFVAVFDEISGAQRES